MGRGREFWGIWGRLLPLNRDIMAKVRGRSIYLYKMTELSNFCGRFGPWTAKYWPITFFAICDHIKITCSKSDLRSDQDHDLEFSQKVIGDKIVILDHFLGRSLWIFFPQFSELRFGFNIVVWVLFPNNSSFLCIFQVRIFDLRLLIKDSNFYWLCQVLSLESDTRLCIKNTRVIQKKVPAQLC